MKVRGRHEFGAVLAVQLKNRDLAPLSGFIPDATLCSGPERVTDEHQPGLFPGAKLVYVTFAGGCYHRKPGILKCVFANVRQLRITRHNQDFQEHASLPWVRVVEKIIPLLTTGRNYRKELLSGLRVFRAGDGGAPEKSDSFCIDQLGNHRGKITDCEPQPSWGL